MMWSVPVATGTVTGWLESNGRRIELRRWRVYHDHIWGQFRRSSTTWAHWDFVLKTPSRGEAWILNGLEPTKGGFETYPHDDRWQGVLVHVTPRGVAACQARITGERREPGDAPKRRDREGAAGRRGSSARLLRSHRRADLVGRAPRSSSPHPPDWSSEPDGNRPRIHVGAGGGDEGRGRERLADVE